MIDLCLNIFHWADFRRAKGAIKLHVGLDHDGYIPTFLTVTPGRIHDIKPKLTRLLDDYQIRLVYPFAREKWILRVTADGEL